MSQDIGRIERWIDDDIDKTHERKDGTVHISTWNVLVNCFQGEADVYARRSYEFTPAQRKAVVRAMRSYVNKHRQYGLMGGKGHKQLFLYDAADPVSIIWAEACVATNGPMARTTALAAARERGDPRAPAAHDGANPL